jgi:hypothetical protein
MKSGRGWIPAALAAIMLTAATASAQLQPLEHREPRPGSAALAALGNVLFVPVRVAVTTVGAGLGGLTGWLTAGNRHAAHDVWGLFDGQQYLQPEMLYGDEVLEMGHLQFRMHVTE